MEKGIKAKGRVERAVFDPRVLVFIKRECFSIVLLGFIE